MQAAWLMASAWETDTEFKSHLHLLHMKYRASFLIALNLTFSIRRMELMITLQTDRRMKRQNASNAARQLQQ